MATNTGMNDAMTIGNPAMQGATTGMTLGGPYGAAIGGAIGAGYGIYQLADAKKKRDELMKLNRTRPTYQIPGQIGENTAMYRNMAQNTRVPGQNIAENNIYQGQANQNKAIIGTGRNAGQIMASLVGANQNTTNSLNQLAVQGASLNQQNKDKYARQMQTQADYSDRAWDMNTFQPYQQRLDEFNRGMAMNRQQQQQGVQTLMNAGTLLGGLAGGGGRNQRVGGQRDYANEGFSPYAQNDDVKKAGSNAWFQQHLANGMNTPNQNPNLQYGNNNGFTPISNQNYLTQSGNSSFVAPQQTLRNGSIPATGGGQRNSVLANQNINPYYSGYFNGQSMPPTQYNPYGQGYNFQGTNSYFKPY